MSTCFGHCEYLIQTKVSVAFSYGLAEVVGERVQHAVVGVHRRQAILIQLISHNAHKLLHSLIIISPITNNLSQKILW